MGSTPVCLHRMLRGIALLIPMLLVSPAIAGKTPAGEAESLIVDPQVFDAAVQKLQDRQRDREKSRAESAGASTQQASSTPEVDAEVVAARARKLEMLKGYDARLASARAALRQRMIPPSDVRRLVEERSAFLSLPIDRFRELIQQVDQQNAERLQRFQEAFGDLPTAAYTVTVILMKSGQIDFATPLPEDPLTREVEEARGVRRAYFQFYLNPPGGAPRRHNGWVEFIFDKTSGLWVPTWTDYSGIAVPLFDAEAFLPLRPYDLVFDGKGFAVAQPQAINAPAVFALLAPRWAEGPIHFAPRNRW